MESSTLAKTRAGTAPDRRGIGEIDHMSELEEKGEAGHSIVPSARTLLQKAHKAGSSSLKGHLFRAGSPDPPN